MPPFKINQLITDNFINLNIKEKIFLATAELSLTDEELAKTYLIDSNLDLTKINKIFFFNRLSVPAKIRNQGYGTALMKELIKLADQKDFLIINTANSYGDLEQNKLISWYQKFGMQLLNEDGLLIYHQSLKQKNKVKTKF